MRVNFRRRPPSIEFELLVECCRWSFAGEHGEAVAQLVECIDWDRFVVLSDRHRVQGLAWRCLRNFEAEVPAAIAEQLSDQASALAAHNLRSAQLSRALLETFEAAGVPLVFVKGLTLSQLAYGDPFLKMGWDIDVLVSREDLEKAAVALSRMGLRPIIPANPAAIVKWHRRRKESVWRSREGLHVELHTRLADNPEIIPSIGIDSATQEVTIAPGVELPTLKPEDLFAYLSVHGASSAWSRLKWIADFTALFHDRPAGQLERFYRYALGAGTGRAVDQAYLLARRVFGFPAIQGAADGGAGRWLANVAWDQLTREHEPTATIFGTLPIHYTQLFLLPGLRFKLSEAGRQISDWADKPR